MKTLSIVTVVMAARLLAEATPVLADFSGTWTQEWAVATPLSMRDSQKFESVIEPQWRESVGESTVTARLRIRLDTVGALGPDAQKPDNYSSINGPWVNNGRAELSLRELYIDGERYGDDFWPDMEWRLGKQQVVWGQADGLKVLDVVNPQSYREFILDQFEDSRIPLWMLNVTLPVNDHSALQILWIPDTTYHELAEAGTPYQITTPELVPQPMSWDQNVQWLAPSKPSGWIEDSDVGLRYATFWHGWDVTLNYLYQYLNLPVLSRQAGSEGVIIQPQYERSHLIGGSVSNALGDFTLRAEVGYRTDSYYVTSSASNGGVAQQPEIAMVLGLDWQGLSNTLISGQWFQSHLFDYQQATVRDQTDHTFSVLIRRDFINDTWRADLLTLHSLNNGDGVVRPRLKHTLLSALDVWGGLDIFYGNNNGLYGQFDHQDRLVLGFEWGF